MLVNFRDYGPDRRGISAASLDGVLSAAPFTSRTFRPQSIDTSMANCFGLHALHAFLTVPFLAHKRAVLTRALESNTAAMGAAHKALGEVRSATYEEFAGRLEATARAEAAQADMARLAVAEAAAQAERAEAEKWSWLTGDSLAQPPGPGGAPGGPPRAQGMPVVQPGKHVFRIMLSLCMTIAHPCPCLLAGGGVFAVVPPGALLSSRPLPAPPAASEGVGGGMLSYLGGLGSTLGSATSYLSSFVSAPPPPKTATARLDDFLGAPAPGGAGGAAPGGFLDDGGADSAEAQQRAPPARRSRGRHPGMKQHDWDSDDDSDDGGPGLSVRTGKQAPVRFMLCHLLSLFLTRISCRPFRRCARRRRRRKRWCWGSLRHHPGAAGTARRRVRGGCRLAASARLRARSRRRTMQRRTARRGTREARRAAGAARLGARRRCRWGARGAARTRTDGRASGTKAAARTGMTDLLSARLNLLTSRTSELPRQLH